MNSRHFFKLRLTTKWKRRASWVNVEKLTLVLRSYYLYWSYLLVLISSFLLLSVPKTCFTKRNITDLCLTWSRNKLCFKRSGRFVTPCNPVATLSRVKTRSTFQPRSVNNGLDVCFEDRSRNQSRFSTNRLLLTTNTYLYRCHDLPPQSSFPFCFITKLNVTLSVLWLFICTCEVGVEIWNPHHVWFKT